jgi:hypothetical protein
MRHAQHDREASRQSGVRAMVCRRGPIQFHNFSIAGMQISSSSPM